MRKDSKSSDFAKNILLTVVGGLGLFVATAILNSMFSAPVSRASFDAHKAETNRHIKNIDYKLDTLKKGQNQILEHLLDQRGKK